MLPSRYFLPSFLQESSRGIHSVPGIVLRAQACAISGALLRSLERKTRGLFVDVALSMPSIDTAKNATRPLTDLLPESLQQ